jgi:hypothetical protein
LLRFPTFNIVWRDKTKNKCIILLPIQRMSLNVLVSAAVQRTGLLPAEPADDPAKNKKRKRTGKEGSFAGSGSVSGSNGHSGIEDEEEKQRKRRAQIAEASRRSRARRKKEFQDFKEENDQLWSQNMMLRKTLEDMGVYVLPPLVSRVDRGSSTPGGGASHANSSDDEDDDGASQTPSPAASPMAPTHAHLPTQIHAGGAGSNGGAGAHPLLQWMTMNPMSDSSDSSAAVDSNSGNPAGFQEFCQFFERRLSWYFTQLKSDAIRSFASHLPFEDKQKIANLAVKLVPKDNASPALTPNLAGMAAAARLASASTAEQAVDQDRAVRL